LAALAGAPHHTRRPQNRELAPFTPCIGVVGSEAPQLVGVQLLGGGITGLTSPGREVAGDQALSDLLAGGSRWRFGGQAERSDRHVGEDQGAKQHERAG
jgi:hypothetical protein